MKILFRTRCIMGILGLLTPTLSFLFYIGKESFLLLLLVSFGVSIGLGRLCYSHLPFKLWLGCLAGISAYGAFLATYWQGTAMAYVGVGLFGLGAGALIFLVPSDIAVGWFSLNRALTLGSVTSLALLLAYVLSLVMEAVRAGAVMAIIGLGGLVMILSAGFLLEKPVMINYHESHLRPVLSSSHTGKNRIKAGLFFLFIALAGALALQISAGPAGYEYMASLMGLMAGPFLVSFFVHKKGIYASCVLLLFLAELSVMWAGFYSGDAFMTMAGSFARGAMLSSPLVICPLLTYYLLGPGSFKDNLARICVFLPLGFCAYIPLSWAGDQLLSSTATILATLFLLVAGFFMLFSAWKHRLFLLKKV